MSIVMGDDEFILYIRKQYPNCKTGNDDLGTAIWRKLQILDPNAKIKKPDAPCYWGNSGPFVAVNKLPKTAAQFSFDRACLPQIYDFLDQLGQQE
jgi:hypothetical protein